MRKAKNFVSHRGFGVKSGSIEFGLHCADFSIVSRRPKAASNVRAVIAAQATDLADVGVRFQDRLLQITSEADHIGNAVTG